MTTWELVESSGADLHGKSVDARIIVTFLKGFAESATVPVLENDAFSQAYWLHIQLYMIIYIYVYIYIYT